MRALVALSVAVLVASCGAPTSPAPSVGESGDLRVSGPYVYENVAVYLLHRGSADPQEYLALDEGLKSGAVEVSEKEEGQVSRLLVENRSELPLFIQEGDRLQGGKQDRIVGISLVVPPKSGKVAVPAFCVEQGRWARGEKGDQFVNTSNRAFAGNAVRYAGKVQSSQHAVWDQVAKQKDYLNRANGAPNTNSSLNEAIDSKPVMEMAAGCEKALGDLASRHGDAVGAAFAVNGRLEEVVVYPGPALLRKVYPRLLGSYAIQAASDRKPGSAPGPEAVAAFMKEGAQKKREETREVDRDNACRLAEFEKKAYCESRYRGKVVCTQWLAEPEGLAGAPARNGAVQGQTFQTQEEAAPPRRR
jgi:hypothetical protein